MNDSIFTRIGKVFRFFLFHILFFLIRLKKQQIKSKTLLIVRLDSIGDYLLIQNLLGSFKGSKKYHEYKITLCGNAAWKDLAEYFNRDFFDNFIWLDRDKFHNNIFYKYKYLTNVYKQGFEVAIDTTFSREMLFGDAIVKASNAAERIGSLVVADTTASFKRRMFTDRFYTQLIDANKFNVFEFYRSRSYLESIIDEKISIEKPFLNCQHIQIELPTKKSFAVIFPGAQEIKRRWSTSNFEIIIEHLIRNFGLNVIIAGSKHDSEIAKKMVRCYTSKACFDLTGKTTLPQLAKLISSAKILISNETSAVHFAVSVDTPFVCISNAQRYGRFMPYPSEMNVIGTYIYPDEIENNLDRPEYLINKYKYNSDLDINSIQAKKVINAVNKILNYSLI